VLLAALCVGLTSYVLLARRGPRAVDLDRRLSLSGRGDYSMIGGAGDVIHSDTINPLAEQIARLSKPLEVGASDRNQLALKLAQAGIRKNSAVAVFLGAKMLLLILGGLAGAAYALPNHLTGTELLAVILLPAAIGFYLPSTALRMAANRRAERIDQALPDGLDMLVVAVEAGLGLDAAIQRVADELQRASPDLAEEWRVAVRETQMGIPRNEAMAKMADRSNVPDMRTLVAVLMQAERLGTSIAQTLRVHAETSRVKRRQRAEERAAKTTVKLLFPLLMFIFPTIFIVILGPVAVRVIEHGFF
jgi:tight adherence protein C